MNLSQFRPFK